MKNKIHSKFIEYFTREEGYNVIVREYTGLYMIHIKNIINGKVYGLDLMVHEIDIDRTISDVNIMKHKAFFIDDVKRRMYEKGDS